jgi:hypothetical protein
MTQLDTIPWSWWESINQISVRGTPDIIGCINGRYIGLELKSSAKGVVSKMQEYKLQKIEEAGGIALVIHPDNFDESFEFLKQLGEDNVSMQKRGRMESSGNYGTPEHGESETTYASELEIDATIEKIRGRSQGRGSITQVDN